MKIALLGYGKEGRATEEYFKKLGAEIEIFENFTNENLKNQDFSSFDLVFRSPSVPFRAPVSNLPNLTSVTRYFFEHCPCPIIGVTASKGKGTTCSFIKSLLESFKEDVHLVGNIGVPAISKLDELKPTSVVVYELSSFQLWDLQKSPEIAVIGTIAPDHLNVHKDFSDYINAKANICRYQTTDDCVVYYSDNPDSVKIAENSVAKNRIAYPYVVPPEIKTAVKLPGEHNLNNALAALAAVAAYKTIARSSSATARISEQSPATRSNRSNGQSSSIASNRPDNQVSASFRYLDRQVLDNFIKTHLDQIVTGLSNCQGLPHRLQYLRDLNSVSYYDDNFSTNPASTRVAVQAFPNRPVVLIAGGRDKTENADLPEIVEILKSPNVARVVLMGESGHEIFAKFSDEPKFLLTESLETAITMARAEAEKLISQTELKKGNTKKEVAPADPLNVTEDTNGPVVLMSPAAASFDMFKDVYDRGAKYQALIRSLA